MPGHAAQQRQVLHLLRISTYVNSNTYGSQRHSVQDEMGTWMRPHLQPQLRMPPSSAVAVKILRSCMQLL